MLPSAAPSFVSIPSCARPCRALPYQRRAVCNRPSHGALRVARKREPLAPRWVACASSARRGRPPPGDDDGRRENDPFNDNGNGDTDNNGAQDEEAPLAAKQDRWAPLEMAWRLQTLRHSPPQECRACRGRGEVECPMCHGTGFLTLGDSLLCSIDGGNKCPLCTDGYVTCDSCKGAGLIAAWLQGTEGEVLL